METAGRLQRKSGGLTGARSRLRDPVDGSGEIEHTASFKDIFKRYFLLTSDQQGSQLPELELGQLCAAVQPRGGLK